MQLVALKFFDAVRALHQQAALGHASRLEVLGGFAVEQHERALGRLRGERRAFADGAVDDGLLSVERKGQLAAGDRFAGGAAGEGDCVAVACAVVLALLRRAVVAVAGQAAGVEHQPELAAAERDDLCADVKLAGQHSGVFALERVVGIGLGRISRCLVLGCGNGNQPGQQDTGDEAQRESYNSKHGA